MTGFSDTVMAEIIGGGVTIVTTLITALFAWLTNRPAPPESPLYVPDSARAARRRRQWGFRVDYLWIPIVFGGGVILTLICMLAFQHEARQNLKKILYDSPEFHMNRGDQLAGMGNFAGAELEYYEVIEDDNSDALAHDKRAVALAKDGRLEEALEENLNACALAPDVAQYHNNKGVTLFEMGNHKGLEGNEKAEKQYLKNAVEAYKAAVELDSTVADYHYNLSKALFITYNVDDAISECATALQSNPEKAEYHCLYAQIFGQIGEYKKAEDEARKSLEINSNNAEAYRVLGMALERLNQFDEAISAFRQAIQINPDNGIYHSYLGIVLYTLGHYREALKEHKADLALTLNIDPPYEQSIVYANVADTLIALNRYEEALQYAEKGIETYPDNPNNHYLRYALLTYFNRHEEAAQELIAAYELGGIPLPEEYT